MDFFMAFLVGGLICTLGQLFIDLTKLTPGHLMGLLVFIGAGLDTFGLYDKLIEIAGAGALVPITSFGHSILHGAMDKAGEYGFLGIGMGMFDITAVGITSAIIFAFIVAVIFKPKA